MGESEPSCVPVSELRCDWLNGGDITGLIGAVRGRVVRSKVTNGGGGLHSCPTFSPGSRFLSVMRLGLQGGDRPMSWL
ncbi:hypothetical protein CgunFtcFv8_009756 [Champsocephalus gunnari]|uniref:Uncharacterized protein n=1 Tax=Champsocephalus gunnari TaxID=52237 RepID=A0AAN8GZC8_CHAGU|nr:hypothetical protein CgunFtcFv8_009756 [Champsocephalus gunnari]